MCATQSERKVFDSFQMLTDVIVISWKYGYRPGRDDFDRYIHALEEIGQERKPRSLARFLFHTRLRNAKGCPELN